MLRARVVFLLGISALALVATGCPAPTGRHRGVDGGTTCAQQFMPAPNSFCRVPGESCEFPLPCFDGGTSTTSCTCVGRLWSCGMPSMCIDPNGGDADTPRCPVAAPPSGASCTAREATLSCSYRSTMCETSVCYCTGTQWSCFDRNVCDAGMTCPPEVPDTTIACSGSTMCVYPADLTHACDVDCVCNGATFSCWLDCDGTSAPDVTDASADVFDADDARDATDFDAAIDAD